MSTRKGIGSLATQHERPAGEIKARPEILQRYLGV
jgi:hypothetical protein